ncbi:MAG: adenylate cyclase [Blastocatellia bacterium]|jgi:class 3 adenylate cyclase|nr:adenylate cyclase [Blastocatellia bacterium]
MSELSADFLQELFANMAENVTLRDWLGVERGPIVLVFTDIVGSTKLAVGMGDRGWIPVLKGHFDKARQYKKLHHGYEVKLIGDACMMAFKTPDDALEFSRKFIADTGHARISIRAAIHLGDVRVVENDIYGVMVNYTSRMQHVIKDGIVLSDAAKVRIEHELGEGYVHQFTFAPLSHEPLADFPPDQQTLWKIGPALTLEQLSLRGVAKLGPIIRGSAMPIPPKKR